MLTKEEFIQYSNEIKAMYKARRIMLPFGLVFLLAPIIIMAGIFAGDYENIQTYIGLCSFVMVNGIVVLILRSALFNARIKNRKRAIKESKQELEMHQLYDRNDSSK